MVGLKRHGRNSSTENSAAGGKAQSGMCSGSHLYILAFIFFWLKAMCHHKHYVQHSITAYKQLYHSIESTMIESLAYLWNKSLKVTSPQSVHILFSWCHHSWIERKRCFKSTSEQMAENGTTISKKCIANSQQHPLFIVMDECRPGLQLPDIFEVFICWQIPL